MCVFIYIIIMVTGPVLNSLLGLDGVAGRVLLPLSMSWQGASSFFRMRSHCSSIAQLWGLSQHSRTLGKVLLNSLLSKKNAFLELNHSSRKLENFKSFQRNKPSHKTVEVSGFKNDLRNHCLFIIYEENMSQKG